MSSSQSVQSDEASVSAVDAALGDSDVLVPPPPPPPGNQMRRAEDRHRPPPAPPSRSQPDNDLTPSSPSETEDGPPTPPSESGPGSTNYELDLLERKADHTAARMGAHRRQLASLQTSAEDRFRARFESYVDAQRRRPGHDGSAVRFPTPNKIQTRHHELLVSAALLVRSGLVSSKLLDELDQLQAELHQGVCDLRQERSYGRQRNGQGGSEIEQYAERLSEKVHAPRVERVERRARRVLARASVPGDFESLVKEYRRDFADYSATLSDVVADLGGADDIAELDHDEADPV